MDISEEISAMLDSLDNPFKAEQSEVTEEEKKEPESEAEEQEPEPEDSEAATDESSEQGQKEEKEEPSEAQPSDQVTELKAQIAALQAQLAELAKGKDKAEPPEEPTLTEQSFISEDEAEDLINDPSALNKVLNKVYMKAASDIQAMLSKRLPDIVTQQVQVIKTLESIRDAFYEENSDLKPFNKVVSIVYDELSEAHKDKPLQDVLKLVAPEVRKRLNLPAKSAESQTKPPRLPNRNAKAGNLKVVKPTNQNPTVNEIDEMNKALFGG